MPDAIAVRSSGETLSYAQLDRRAGQLAAYLQARGVVSGTAVGVAIDRSISLPIALLGILACGAAYVPIDTSAGPLRRKQVIDDAGIAFVITAGASESFDGSGAELIDLERDAADIAIDRVWSAPQLAPTSLAYIMYTSGTTGRPKGVAVEHRAIVRLVRGTDYVSITPDDVVLQFAPSAFDASTFEIWAPLLNGATLAIAPPGALSLGDLGASLASFGVTTLWLTAPLFRMMVETELPAFRGLRTMITGGDVVSPAHARRFLEAAPRCRLVNGYGPTENTTFSCAHVVTPADDFTQPLPIGRPIANSAAYVLDEAREPVAVGVAGELYVGGDGLAREYVNLPELTAERFVRNPFAADGTRLYRTGDRARVRADGVIEFLGRSDRQVKIRGFRVELDDIEAALNTHPGVQHAAVVVEDRAAEKSLVAIVAPIPGAKLDEAGLRTHARATLPASMVPHRFSIEAALPTLTSGKIDRNALRPVFGRRSPASGTQAAVDALWSALLETAAFGPDDNFFDAGGDSVLLLALHARLRAAFAVDLGVTELFAATTIRSQAALIEKLRG